MQVLDLLKCVHKSGFVYNDLKIDNIMIGMSRSTEVSSDIKLIDFGLAKPYLDPDGKHIEREKVDKFAGNFLFSSPNAYRYQN